MKKQLLAILSMLITFSAISQTPDRGEFIKNIRKGNKAYKNGNYEEADVSYRRAMEVNSSSFDAVYNLANTEYKKEGYEDAAKRYSSIIGSTEDKLKKADAYHNLGNALLSEEKYKECIDAYKNALKLRPDDIETKSNLAYAKKKLEEQEGEGGGGDQNQDQNQDQQNQDQQNQDQQNQDQQNQDQQNQNQQNQDQQNQNSQQGQQPKLSPQEAQQLLEAIQADERAIQEKVNREKAKAVGRQTTEKNW